MFQKKRRPEGESREMRSKHGKNELDEARKIALTHLATSARSRSELTRRLEQDEFEPDVIEETLIEMESLNYLDDSKFAMNWVEDRADRKGYGKTRLAQELKGKGVDKETIQEALGSIEEESEIANCLAAARTKWRGDRIEGLDRAGLAKEKTKVSNFLQRRGFSWSIITKVFALLLENNQSLS